MQSFKVDFILEELGSRWRQLVTSGEETFNSPSTVMIWQFIRDMQNLSPPRQRVYVYGSSQRPEPTVGSALKAKNYGATGAIRSGFDGRCYALLVADERGFPLSQEEIFDALKQLKADALKSPDKVFFIGSLETGLSHFTTSLIGPSLKMMPDNVTFDERWWRYL